jgi:hypothetical protein
MITPTPQSFASQFNVARYYTHLSLVLFFIGLVYPKGFIKTGLLLNSVFVGMIGNFITMKLADQWSVDYAPSYILFSNLLQHTIPMFLAFLILFGQDLQEGKTSHYLLFLSSIFLLWSCLPYNGNDMGHKIRESYGMNAGVLILMTTLVTISTCKAIEYFRSQTACNV